MRDLVNSGIDWLGDMPSHWEVYRNKALFSNVSIKNHGDATVLSLYRELGVIPKDSRDDNHNVTSLDTDSYKYVEQGDLVINKMKAWSGSLGISDYEGIVSPAYYVCKVDYSKVAPRFIHHYLRNLGIVEAYEMYSAGMRIGQWDLGIDDFMSIKVGLPPLQEQERIAERIDTETEKVDALIANQQAQIEKLKQYKQSLITEVVTKGLDPNAPIKDSGVEWIGKIANGHQIYRLKFLLTAPMMYGANESGSKETKNSVRYIRITDITTDSKLKDDENNLYLSLDVAKDYLLVDGDVLFARSGGTVGKSFIYRSEYGESAFAGYLIKAECNTEKLLPEYLFYYTLSSLYEQWKNMIFIQATIQNIGASKYSNMEIVVPSIQEQKHIVEFLARKCRKIDRLIDIKNQKIEKLNDYKKSLIYEYVTGKKEVQFFL